MASADKSHLNRLRGKVAGADGTAAADDFLPGAVTDCGVSTDIWANVYAYDTTKYPENPPATVAEIADPAIAPPGISLSRLVTAYRPAIVAPPVSTRGPAVASASRLLRSKFTNTRNICSLPITRTRSITSSSGPLLEGVISNV